METSISNEALQLAFSRKYNDRQSDWSGHSGGGSDPYYTTDYRAFLDKFIRMNRITSIVDIGCGDWQFSRFLNLDRVGYLGLDVVPEVIASNIARYQTDSIKFAMMPDHLPLIPKADLLLMKDVLQHLPNAEIIRFQKQVFPKFEHSLITNSFRKLNTPTNTDIKLGGFRCLDLRAEPFNFRGHYVLQFASPLWEEIRVFKPIS